MREAERYLRVTRKTIGKLIREGRLPAAKVGRSYRFLKSELDRFLLGRGMGIVADEANRKAAEEFLTRLRDGLYAADSSADDHDSIYGE